MNKTSRLAVALPLIGAHLTWLAFMFATWVGTGENGSYADVTGVYTPGPEIKLSAYLSLLGIALFAALASASHSIADSQQIANSKDRAAHAAFRFASLSVIVALAALVVYAFTMFLSSFGNSMFARVTLAGRLLGVYLPIILATAIVVVVLLRATVFRKSEAHSKDASGKTSPQQRAMVLGYTLPVVAAALAIIIGMVFWDTQGQTLDSWVWVLILAIIAGGIIFGTNYAAKARAGVTQVAKPKVSAAGAIGAINLNYVLSIVFVAFAMIMGFAMGANAVSSASATHRATSDWFINDLLPTYLLLVLGTVGVYFTLVLRHRAPKSE